MKSEHTLDMVAAALCADYFRRAEAIAAGKLSRRTLMEYRYLNCRIFEAAMEQTADREDALAYIEEIGARRGYAFSRFTVSEATYKRRKFAIKEGILTKLHLQDP